MKPSEHDTRSRLRVPDGEPDACKPVGNKDEHEDEEDEYGRTVFDVMVQLSGHSTQPQEPHDLQGTEQTAYTLPNAKICLKLFKWVEMIVEIF